VNGWIDYFESIELNYDTDNTKEITYYDQRNTILDNFTLHEYRNAIHELYIYNEKTKQEIMQIKNKYNLVNNYSSIFIRRGDKLISESNLYSACIYIEHLLKIEPECKRIFIQTDDYNCITEAKEYLQSKKLSGLQDIEIITLCNENTKGMVIISHQQEFLFDVINNKSNSRNKNYLLNVKDNLTNFKPVDQMNSDEIYRHTIDMLIGIDIVLNSNNCVIDFESNVSRFIKIAHNSPNNVYDINNSNVELDKIYFPAYGF